MQAIQTQSMAVDFLPTVAPPGTLGDLRMGQDNYANASSFSAKSMRPLLIVVILIAVGAAIAWGLNKSPENVAAPTVPAAASLPVMANDIPVVAPLIPLIKSAEVSPVPSVAPANTRSSESVKPVKAKSVAAVKAAPVAAKKVARIPASPVNEIAAPAPEVAPPAAPPAPVTPAAIVIEEKPVAPPVEPAAQ